MRDACPHAWPAPSGNSPPPRGAKTVEAGRMTVGKDTEKADWPCVDGPVKGYGPNREGLGGTWAAGARGPRGLPCGPAGPSVR